MYGNRITSCHTKPLCYSSGHQVGVYCIAIGSIVALEAMFAGPVCGASMNPARSFSPAIVSGHMEHLWLYIIAPILGAVVAVPVFNILKGESK